MLHRAHFYVSGAAFALLAGCVSDVVIVEHDLRDPPVEAIVTPPVNTVESSWSSPSHYADPVDLSAGDRHACARGSDQGVYCWGDNHRGQSGDGDLDAPRVRPRRVPCVEGARAVIAGATQTGVITAEGTFQYWGRNSPATGVDRIVLDPCSPASEKRFDDVLGATLSEDFSLAWNRRGEVLGWDSRSPLALIADISREPARHRWFEGTFEVAMNARPTSGHACVRDSQGVHCWGYTRAPDGASAWYGPFLFNIADGVSRIAAGVDFTCVVSNARTVWCWGTNRVGQLGLGHNRDQIFPQPVRGLSNVAEVALGRQHACALTRAGEVWCWGANDSGQLGSLEPEIQSFVPVRVRGITDATQVVAGQDFACALTRDRKAWCWGANKEGQLGCGDNVEHDRPMRVAF